LERGNGSDLIVTWTAAEVDETHGPCVGFALRFAVAGTWTVVPGVSSPYTLSGLPSNAAVDVELQAANTAGASAWAVVGTLVTGLAAPAWPGSAQTPAPAPRSSETLLACLASSINAWIAAGREQLLAGLRKVASMIRLLCSLVRLLRFSRTR
jgi:hypothetical protein